MGEGRGIYSVAMFHVGASCVSLAPTFFKSQSALTPPLLLSKPDPLWLGSGLVFLLYCKVRFAPAYFFACGFKKAVRPRFCFTYSAEGHASSEQVARVPILWHDRIK